jgi:hypothetical protein
VTNLDVWRDLGPGKACEFRDILETKRTIKQHWVDYANEAAGKGSKGHKDLELFVNKVPVDNKTVEFQQGLDFLADQLKQGWVPFRTEQRNWSKKYRVPGSIDLQLRRIKNPYNSKGQLIIRLVDYKFTPLYHDLEWMFQLNLYKYMLEDPIEGYNCAIHDMFIVTFNAKQPSYRIFEIPDIQPIIRKNLEEERGFMIALEDQLADALRRDDINQPLV